MVRSFVLLACLVHFLTFDLFAQGPKKPNAADILSSIQKLNVLGSVLYVAAHPDDENTRLIAYLSKERHFDVTYLSLTRGDGGQNLIGNELRELLGVLRSEELLMARSIDGGKQLFSRANDFGYSKTPAETLRIWDEDAVMNDMVRAIRATQPDVMINRFYHEEKYPTHGHHTASAALSVKAFDLASQNTQYKDQLNKLAPWQAQRLFFNTSWFFYGSRDAFDKMDKSQLYSVDVGNYLPLAGKSVTEIAAEARSQHKCQGFGMLSSRGSSMEYLEHIKGSKPPLGADLFDGVNTSWSRLEGGAKIGKLLSKVEQKFQMSKPEASVPDLVAAMQLMKRLPASHWKTKKLAEIKQVIAACLGLYFEGHVAETFVAPGDSLAIKFEAINRSGSYVQLNGVSLVGLWDTLPVAELAKNKLMQFGAKIKVPANTEITAPYWLLDPWSVGMYRVDHADLIGKPETPRAFRVKWSLNVGKEPMELETDVYFKTGEPAIGEVFAPLEVLPPVSVAFDKKAMYSTQSAASVSVTVQSSKANANGTVSIKVPTGWKTEPASAPFQIRQKGGKQTFVFKITPQAGAGSTVLEATAEVDGQTCTRGLVEIKYDHIPTQSVLLPAQMQYTPLDLKCTAKQIGYYAGAGDDIASSLSQVGCTVVQLNDADMTAERLATFDCIIMGIRAYNTKDALKFHNALLMNYVQGGGTLVVQYNTNHELVLTDLAPYKMKLSRNRVTEEDAVVTILAPDHPLLQYPNRITATDFDGWVQERGLYFPNEWGPEFMPLISCHDTNEPAADGSILVADYGKGKYIYTGLSFFRQLPEGVPGAMRLFANMLSAGKK